MDFWRTKRFKRLHRHWNKKLQDAGFQDHENGNGNLKQRASNCYRQANELERETRLSYYLRLGNEINRTQFENSLERIVMEMHADGLTIEEIVKRIEQLGFSRHRQTIRLTIRKYLVHWKMTPINIWPQMSRKRILIR